ncbi:MAG: hypothetical protein ABI402_07870 [Ferruginibacter sp.]
MRSLFLFVFFLFGFVKMQGQTYLDKDRTIRKVFNRLVEAYGNARSAPDLKLLPNDQSERVVAQYTNRPRPTIKIDEQLVDICLKLKEDSLNALSIIISHELAHYYNDHSFCVDFAYAIGKKSKLSKELINQNAMATNKFGNETNADYEGIWHAAIAGYNPFNVFESMIDRIYSEYKLNGTTKDYPSKSDRKKINKTAEQKATGLLPTFKAGFILTKIGMYDEAAACFDDVALSFPSRENYYNAGVARLLLALELKTKRQFEFIYPFELDPASRLTDYTSRGTSESNTDMKELIKKAKNNLTRAMSLDPSYINASIAYACAWEIDDNFTAAIGELAKVPLANKNDKINLAYAIMYFNKKMDTEASGYFKLLSMGKDSITNYDLTIYRLSGQPTSVTKISKYSSGWKDRNHDAGLKVDDEMISYFKKTKQTNEPAHELSDEKISIYSNEAITGIEIYISNKKLLRAITLSTEDCTSQIIVEIDVDWMKEHKELKKQWWLIKL